MLLTVAICTYRRPERVSFVLDSLCRQNRQQPDWEVLLVENDKSSSPAMVTVCERFMRQLPLRHIVETHVGLSNARNAAQREAKGDYIAFLDDDAEADTTWLNVLMDACRESIPDFCGGPVYPLYKSSKPVWYRDQYATGYVYGEHARWLNQREYLGGMNFVVKRMLCIKLGGFNTGMGMNGENIAYGEDTDLMVRAWASNPKLKVRYLPLASIKHEIRPEKMKLFWNIRAAWAGGRSSVIMSPLKRSLALHGIILDGKEMIKNIYGFIHFIRKRGYEYRCIQQWIIEVFCPWLWHYSRNFNALFLKKDEFVTR